MVMRLFAGISLAVSLAFAAPDPVAMLKKNDAELQVILKKKTHSDKDIEKVKVLSSGVFDFGKMAEKSLPKETWKKLDDSAKVNFTNEFRRMVENASVKKFRSSKVNGTDSTIFSVPVMKKDGAEAWVTVMVWNKGKAMEMLYKMELTQNGWQAWDLVIDGLSTTLNYKDQFKTILASKPFPELVATIKKKADEYAQTK